MMDATHASKFVEFLKLISAAAHAVNVHNGWWGNEDSKFLLEVSEHYEGTEDELFKLPEDMKSGLKALADKLQNRNDGELFALMHSEISEALEATRHGNPPSDHIPEFSGTEEEMADVVIRVMDYCEKRSLRLGEAIIAKLHFNYNRGYRHGGKAC